MGGQHGISGKTEDVNQPPAADYHVTGTLVPNINCNYFILGTFNGKNYIKWSAGEWYVFWDGIEFWHIKQALNPELAYGWTKGGASIEGNYNPTEGGMGIAVVAAGPH